MMLSKEEQREIEKQDGQFQYRKDIRTKRQTITIYIISFCILNEPSDYLF